MHRFLTLHRDELIERCAQKVAQRPLRVATEQQLALGVPMFLDQLTRTLAAEDDNQRQRGEQISGPAGGDALALSEIGLSATRHGKELLELGYTVDQVVHDYGDLCQAITDLTFERDAPFAVDEFRTLNRCLDNAIADAVTEFSAQREAQMIRTQAAGEKQRLGFLVHELRNSLGTATLAVRALELSQMGMGGATGAVLKRSLSMLAMQLGRAITEVSPAGTQTRETFSLAHFIAEAGVAGYEMGYWFAAYAPAGTSPAAVQRLNELMVRATASAQAKGFFESSGSEAFTSTPDGLARFQAAETRKWGEIIKAAGIQAE